jgi:hypothetical protein
LLGAFNVRPADNSIELRITWNNAWRTMTLVRCHGDYPVAAFTIAAASNAVAENPEYTRSQRLPLIRGDDAIGPAAARKDVNKNHPSAT